MQLFLVGQWHHLLSQEFRCSIWIIKLKYLQKMCVGVQMCYSLAVGVCQSNKQNDGLIYIRPSALLMVECGAHRYFDSNLLDHGHLCVVLWLSAQCLCAYVSCWKKCLHLFVLFLSSIASFQVDLYSGKVLFLSTYPHMRTCDDVCPHAHMDTQ